MPFCRTFLALEMETPLVLGSQRQGSQSKEKLARPPHIWTERQNGMTKSQKEVVEQCYKKTYDSGATDRPGLQAKQFPPSLGNPGT